MVEVRQAKASDIPKVVRLLWDDDQGRLRESLSEDAIPQYDEAFAEIENDPNCDLLVAIDDDVVVGCIQINILSGLSYRGIRRCLVEDVRILRTSRGKGYGRRLLEAASSRATDKGCKMIELFVHQDRKDAQAFYEACGFEGNHTGYRRQLNPAEASLV
jgi:ribosomal protein S18 acetylase RimI-like enzyme